MAWIGGSGITVGSSRWNSICLKVGGIENRFEPFYRMADVREPSVLLPGSSLSPIAFVGLLFIFSLFARFVQGRNHAATIL